MRLNKYLSQAGVCSRRKADELIKQGKVKLNGKIVTDMGVQVKENNDDVRVDNKRVKLPSNFSYYMLNKPKGFVCSVKDDLDRRTVMDLVTAKERVYPVGRLDYDTEGLLLFTNDGDIANKLMHPSYEIAKTYIANVAGKVSGDEMKKLANGIELDGEMTKPAQVQLLEFDGKLSRMKLTIHEGRNRQVRRMFEAISKEVMYLKRVGLGDLRLGGMSRAEFRRLREDEVKYINKVTK